MDRASLGALIAAVSLASVACSAKGAGAGYDDTDGGSEPGADGGSSSGSSGGPGSDGGPGFVGEGGNAAPPDGAVTVSTTIYANTDDSLYTLDPKTHAVTLVGKFAGHDGTDITDVAVNGNGDVFVNTMTAVYKAAVPASPGAVQLTKLASIGTKKSGQVFFALAFAPPGVLGPTEQLVGGDGEGELWFIDSTNGAIKDLGSFGKDPKSSKRVMGLSGDLVFYLDGGGKPTGLATIRSCSSGGTSCDTNDFLAGIDMAALSAAYTGTPAASLLSGIYGGSASNPGSGIGFADVFGLGAWEGDVYGFSRSATAPPTLLSIDTKSGKGTALPGSFAFKNGWSGAGVTTKVTITIPPPPPIK